MKKAFVGILLFMFVLSLFSGCVASGTGQSQEYDWSASVLAQMLPVPSKKVASLTELSDTLYATIEKVSENEYRNYVIGCKEIGYTIDTLEDSSTYDAYNTEGYHLRLVHFPNEDLKITLYTPIEMKSIIWPEAGHSVPHPAKLIGEIKWEHEDSFYLFIGETSRTEYDEYVQLCKDAGFTINEEMGQDYFYADNAVGDHLSINYERFNTIRIQYGASDDGVNGETVETSAPTETTFVTEELTEAITTEDGENTPVMSGTSLDAVERVAKEYGLTAQFDDDDWGYGTKMHGMSSDGLTVRVVYKTDTKEILMVSVVNYTNLSTEQEQRAFILAIASVACPQADAETVSRWVESNLGNATSTTINGVSYELLIGPTGNLCYSAGEAEWEKWYLSFE